MMKRREFIGLLGGAAAWPLAARAQRPMPVVGFLSSYSSNPFSQRLLAAFRQGLGETGYVEGRNVAIELRWADGRYERLPALAADLAHRQVSVIAAVAGNVPALAVKAVTATIPVVFETAGDPVASGLVPSLSRPGGNLTGVTSLNSEVGPKRLELLHEVVPVARTIALLVNPRNPGTEATIKSTESTARGLGFGLRIVQVSEVADFDSAFATITEVRADALLISIDAYFISHSDELAARALRHKLPAIYSFREFTAAGGLMSYGGNLVESYQSVGVQVGRILKGERPSDLPVQQATKVELAINLRTAKALGIDFPLTLLGRADEVIE